MGSVDEIYEDWRRIYDILRTAARRKDRMKHFESLNLRAYDAENFETLVEKTLGPPIYPSIFMAPKSLDDCYKAVLTLEEYFHMLVEDFAAIRDINARGNDAHPWEWEQVYATLEQAYAAKNAPKRSNQLKSKHQNSGFDAMIRLALGDPLPGDPLPGSRAFKDLDPDKSLIDAQYIRDRMYLEIAN